MPTNKRKWWLAGLFSLLEPGLGQIYNGQILKGVLFLILPYFLYPLGLYLILNSFSAPKIYLFFALLPIYYIIVLFDSIVQAYRSGNAYMLKKYNRVYVYAMIPLLLGGIDLFFYDDYLKNTLAQTYKIPTSSMEPTLMQGDHILADQRTSARNPVSGDLIIFKFPPEEAKDYIKRVVAVSGDTVEIRNKVLYVNGTVRWFEKYTTHTDDSLRGPGDNYGPVVVPKDSFFVLGDNRDKSYDSRYWGFVDKAKIKGKAVFIYWSWDPKKRVVRWDRIGLRLPQT